MHEALMIAQDPAGAFSGGTEQKSSAVRHAALRAILVIEHCPETAERAFVESPNSADHWIADIRRILAPYYAQKAMAPYFTQLAHRLTCSSRTPFVCRVGQQLLDRSSTDSPLAEQNDSCRVFGTTLMSEAVADSKDSGGDFGATATDLAFLLTTCPQSFFSYMHADKQELDAWLKEVQRSLFWGDPKDELALKSYRRSLINFVDRQPTEYKKEKKQILARLEQSQVQLTK